MDAGGETSVASQWVSLSERCPRPQDLADDLSTELSGNFRSVVLGLLMLPPVYDAYELRTAIKVCATHECHPAASFSQNVFVSCVFFYFYLASCCLGRLVLPDPGGFSHHLSLFSFFRESQGAGTEEACLIDILASRSNDEIKTINAFYKKSEWLRSVYE